MRLVLRRLVAFVTVAGSAVYLLQATDRVPPSPASPSASAGSAVVAPAPLGHDFYSRREAVVPYGRTTLELPILMYHYVRVPPSPRSDPLGYRLSIAPAVFAAQMDWLETHGYHTVTFNDVRKYWERLEPLPSKPVIISLDDGYGDLYTTAYAILAEHRFTAVAYIVSGFVGKRGYVTQSQALEMDRYGIEIGAHTVTHADLARSPQPWLAYQVSESKTWLEKLLGHPVLDMAYPSGKYDQTVIAAVERAGYYSATTEVYSVLHTQRDRYEWGRVRVTGGEPLALFIASLGPTMPTVVVTRPVVDASPAAMQQRT